MILRDNSFERGIPWFAVYADGDGEGDPPPPPPPPPPPSPPPPPNDSKLYSQVELNRMLAEDRRKHKAQVDSAVSQLEEVKKSKGLSDQEKTLLQQRIDELNSSLLSKEEQAKREKEKLEKTYNGELEKSKKEIETWRTLFSHETINNAILHASQKFKAISADQISALITPNTRVVEVVDDSGQPTGKFAPKVKFMGVNDGKPVELDLSIEDAVKMMKEIPEKYGNLFESETAGGIGGFNSGRGGRPFNANQPPVGKPEEYRKWRQEAKKRGTV